MKRMAPWMIVGFLAVAIGGSAQSRPSEKDESLAETLREAAAAAKAEFGPDFTQFVESRRRRATSIAKADGLKLEPLAGEFFDAMAERRFPDAERLYRILTDVKPPAIASPMNECLGFYPLYAKIGRQPLGRLARELCRHVPAGGVFFGGTDPGRYLPTWYGEALNTNAGFHLITQNQLVNASYMDYVRAWHGKAVKLPDTNAVQKAFESYVRDAQKRFEHDARNPTAPRQIKPGENVQVDPASGRVSVSGQVAVMSINATIAREIFQLNPDKEFYVEESFPLDWMFPHLVPHGPIMRLEREPVTGMSARVIDADRRYWSDTVSRLLGNWLNRDTSVSEVCRFVRNVHRDHDFAGFTGDPAYIRNTELQKTYSKLRSAIAGVYYYRINLEGREGTLASQPRMIGEADFAFRQAFALCPISPEALFRYTNLLVSQRRVDDALLLALTFQQMDPDNQAANDLVHQLTAMRRNDATASESQPTRNLAQRYADDPTSFRLGVQLTQQYLRDNETEMAAKIAKRLSKLPDLNLAQSTGLYSVVRQIDTFDSASLRKRMIGLADQILANPNAAVTNLNRTAQAFNLAGQMRKLEQTMARLSEKLPNNPETWYDLAGVRAFLNLDDEAERALREAIRLSDVRLMADSSKRDLRKHVATDSRFKRLRELGRIKQLLPSDR